MKTYVEIQCNIRILCNFYREHFRIAEAASLHAKKSNENTFRIIADVRGEIF